MPAQKKVTVQYRYLKKDDLWDGVHLKSMIVDVLQRSSGEVGVRKADLVKLRMIDLDNDGSYVLLNKMSREDTWHGPVFCGQLLYIRRGTEVAAITQSLESELSELSIANLQMGTDERVVDGVLYFALVQNHVGLVQNGKATARALERYLTRLLQDAGEFEPGQIVTLNAKLEGVKAERVQKVSIASRSSTSPNDEVVQSSSAGHAEGHGKTVFDVLEALGWTHNDIAQLQDSLPEDGWIEGIFNMQFKRKGRKKAEVERSVLEEAFRNLDPQSIGLLDADGVREGGGLSKLSKLVAVPSDGDLVDPAETMNKIVVALKEWSAKGRIDCDFEQ